MNKITNFPGSYDYDYGLFNIATQVWGLHKYKQSHEFCANFGEMGIYAKNTLNISDEYRKELLDCIEKIKINFK